MQVESKGCHLHEHQQGDTLMSELMCHFPYAIFSVAVGILVLSLVEFFGLMRGDSAIITQGTHMLFHSFHFVHLAFAASGAFLTYSRFSSNWLRGLIVALCSALFFCTLSDIVLPYLAGRFLGVTMRFHICLTSELNNVVPFLLIGLLNGFVISKNEKTARLSYGLITHVGHIFSSALAALFYMVSEGFTQWVPYMGPLFVLLIMAVVIPCTLADIIIPVVIARLEKERA
jgi:hypothetical protein